MDYRLNCEERLRNAVLVAAEPCHAQIGSRTDPVRTRPAADRALCRDRLQRDSKFATKMTTRLRRTRYAETAVLVGGALLGGGWLEFKARPVFLTQDMTVG